MTGRISPAVIPALCPVYRLQFSVLFNDITDFIEQFIRPDEIPCVGATVRHEGTMEFFCYDTTVRIVVQIIAVRIAEPQINTDSIQFLIVLFPYAFAIFPPYMFSIFTESFYTGSQIFFSSNRLANMALVASRLTAANPRMTPRG